MKLKPGMTANVSIEVAKKDDVLKLPPAALRFRPKSKSDDPSDKSSERNGAHGQRPTVGAPGAAPGGVGKSGPGKTRDRNLQVYLLTNGKPVATPVKTGIANNSSIELTESGLKEGDEVIVEQVGGDTKKKAGAGGSPMGPRF
jgi:HlyD family secretion protein